MDPEPTQVALEAAGAFERVGVPYLLGGSAASGIHGEYRTSVDLDFAAHLDWPKVEPLVAALQEAFFIDIGMIRDAVRDCSSFNVIHRKTFIKVDVFVRPDVGFDRSGMRRAQRVPLGSPSGNTVRVASAEDIVLQKLLWYQMTDGTSDRQWRDVLGVLKVRAESLDRDYLDRWAGELELTRLMERALRESGLSQSR